MKQVMFDCEILEAAYEAVGHQEPRQAYITLDRIGYYE